MRLFYSPAYTAATHVFDTTRKSGWIARSLVRQPVSGVELVEPPPVTARQLEAVHTREYVRAVRTGQPRGLAESNGFPWDPAMWDAVCASTGGVVAAALDAWRTRSVAGSLSSGLHHARAGHGAGFCTFNGLALAAYALRGAGARRIVIVDLDAHIGGGTFSLVERWPDVWQLDVAVVDGFDTYDPDGTDRVSLDLVSDASRYLIVVATRLDALPGDLDVAIYNAGMDVHEDCRTGGCAGLGDDLITAREQLIFQWGRTRGVPIAFVLAGGYTGGAMTQDRLVGLHRITIETAVQSWSSRARDDAADD
jgi:acetoin utilization deacetylase AcuC-like enzyme